MIILFIFQIASGNFLSKWRLDTFTFVKKSNTSKGSKLGQLNGALGLDVDKQEIFVVEYRNKRISVFDLNLEFKRIMANNAIIPFLLFASEKRHNLHCREDW